jgi:hypothetical protein
MSARRFCAVVDLDRGDQPIEERYRGHKVLVDVRRVQLPDADRAIASLLFLKVLVVELVRDLFGKQAATERLSETDASRLPRNPTPAY